MVACTAETVCQNAANPLTLNTRIIAYLLKLFNKNNAAKRTFNQRVVGSSPTALTNILSHLAASLVDVFLTFAISFAKTVLDSSLRMHSLASAKLRLR